MYCYFLSLDMDGCHISDPHIPMRTLYACVYCVPGCPRYPHPLTRLCVWRLLPARLLTDPGLPGSMGIPLVCRRPRALRKRVQDRVRAWEG